MARRCDRDACHGLCKLRPTQSVPRPAPSGRSTSQGPSRVPVDRDAHSLLLVAGVVMRLQQIGAEIAAEIAPNRMDVVAAVCVLSYSIRKVSDCMR